MKRTLMASVLFGAVGLACAGGFTLSSPEIKAGASIPKSLEFNGFGCSGGNQSPSLKWSDAPKDTRSFAVTMYACDTGFMIPGNSLGKDSFTATYGREK